MLTEEEFKKISEDVNNDVPLDNETAKKLIASIYEIDAHLVILQSALQLSVENAHEVIPAVVERLLRMTGRTDKKIQKKAAQFAGEVAARFEVAIQLYLNGAFEKAEEVLAEINKEETETTNEE